MCASSMRTTRNLFASHYFDRILVEHRNVVEGDGPDGKGGGDIILERGMVLIHGGTPKGAEKAAACSADHRNVT